MYSCRLLRSIRIYYTWKALRAAEQTVANVAMIIAIFTTIRVVYRRMEMAYAF